MNQLNVINHNGQLLVESREVAEMIGKPHNDLMKSIRGYVGHLTKGNFSLSNFFIVSSYQDGTGRTLPCFLLTRKGCDMVANKMTGEKGVLFTAAYVTQFEEMEKKLSDPLAGLSPELKAIFTVDKKVQAIEQKVLEVEHKVEAQITLTQGEQRALQKFISAKVYSFALDSQHRSQLFQELYREIKDRWGVPSYRDVLRKDLPNVKRYVDAWHPRVVV